MREILFRGKRFGFNDWVYGNYQHTDCYNLLNDFIGQNACDTAVIPETVCQYTGLTDKNGTKIFEGDIIDYKTERGMVEYTEGEAMYVVSFDTWVSDFDHMNGKEVEVVGNVYDNLELLTQSEE